MIFPNNSWLEKHWWHRLAKIFRIIFALFFIFVAIYYVAFVPVVDPAMNISIPICAGVSIIIAIFGFPLLYKILLYVFVSDWKTKIKPDKKSSEQTKAKWNHTIM